MHLECIRTSNGLLQLDGTNVKTFRVVKYVGLKLHKFPKISIIQDIIIVDLPPIFGYDYLENLRRNLEII